jgi:NAD(P)H-dependent FMN reductase
VAPADLGVEVGSIAGIPLYDGDLEEEQGIPAAAVALRERVAAADGLLLVTPEYNNGVPGVLKNAIDWMSRPPKEIARVFGDKPVGLMGASLGQGGTRLAQAAWLPVLRVLGMRAYSGRQLYVARANEAFDAQGNLTDDKLEKQLVSYMSGLAAFVRERQG